MKPAGLQDFPLEVVIYILKLASQDSTSSCLAICLASSWCLRTALPLLFETAILSNETCLKQLRRLLFEEWEDGQPLTYRFQVPGFRPSKYVRNLWMREDCDGIRKMIMSCDNVEYISMTQRAFFRLNTVWSLDVTPSDIRPPTRPLHLLIHDSDDRWNLSTRYLTKPRSSFANGVTHLRLTHAVPCNRNTLDLTCFSSLTHFAISFEFSGASDLDQLTQLRDRTSLKMIVVVFDGDNANRETREEALDWLKETRCGQISNTYLVEISEAHLRSDWESEVRGQGPSIWDRAAEYTSRIIQAGFS